MAVSFLRSLSPCVRGYIDGLPGGMVTSCGGGYKCGTRPDPALRLFVDEHARSNDRVASLEVFQRLLNVVDIHPEFIGEKPIGWERVAILAEQPFQRPGHSKTSWTGGKRFADSGPPLPQSLGTSAIPAPRQCTIGCPPLLNEPALLAPSLLGIGQR